VILAAGFAFALTLIGAPFMVATLRRLKAAQPIRGIHVQAHQVKRGTPAVGGLIFIGTILTVCIVGHLAETTLPNQQIVARGPTVTGLVLLGFLVGCAVIGFIDDFLKVSPPSTVGLSGDRSPCSQTRNC
jgi:phospho-N-acetylmuramoyl-pentapeptide-transferase